MLNQLLFRLFAGTLIFLCLIPDVAQAQDEQEEHKKHHDFIDTIFVELEGRHKLVMVASSKEQFYTFTGLNARMQKSALQIERIKKHAPDRFRPVHLILDERQNPALFSIKPGPIVAGRTYQLGETSSEPIKTIPDTLTFLLADGQRVLFYLEGIDHLSELANMDIDGNLAPVLDALRNNTHKYNPNSSINASYSIANKALTENKIHHIGTDQIELSVSPGFSLLRGQQVLDFTPRASVILANKLGISQHMFTVKAPFYYFYDGGGDTRFTQRVNTFVELEYGINTLHRKKEVSWFMISAGYLVNENGNYFDSDTYKFGITFNNRRAHRFSVSPQVFFYDSFKKSYPGLRIGFSL